MNEIAPGNSLRNHVLILTEHMDVGPMVIYSPDGWRSSAGTVRLVVDLLEQDLISLAKLRTETW
jgi:hypothetical protein